LGSTILASGLLGGRDSPSALKKGKMTMSPKRPMTTIHRVEDIPSFATEAEEHAFWATHELSEDLWEQAEQIEPSELPPVRSMTSRSTNASSDAPRPIKQAADTGHARSS
jgi:hypothetical protein